MTDLNMDQDALGEADAAWFEMQARSAEATVAANTGTRLAAVYAENARRYRLAARLIRAASSTAGEDRV